MISICLPSRGRPEFFKAMCMSALDTASDPDDIEFVVYRDDDDLSVYEYTGKHKEGRGERSSIKQSGMYNECYKVAEGPIYMFAADDIIFYTKGWDKIVKEVFNKSVDKILFAHPDSEYTDEYGNPHLGAVGFLHKNWIDTVGYFMPPYFEALYADNWINNLAMRVNRKVVLQSIVINHVSAKQDTTKTESLRHAAESKTLYLTKEKEMERTRDADLLQSFIYRYLPKCCTELDIKLMDLFFPSRMTPERRKFVEAHGIYDLPLREVIKNDAYLGEGKVKLFYQSRQLGEDGKCKICEERGLGLSGNFNSPETKDDDYILGNEIGGWMNGVELLWLFNTAKEMDSIVEIGSWKGRSTHALLSGCKGTVYAVDHFLGSKGERGRIFAETRTRDVYKDFMANVGNFKNLKVLKMDSAEAVKQFEDKSVDMVFIDAGHTYEETLADIKRWLPKTKKIICGHDLYECKPVEVAVREMFGDDFEKFKVDKREGIGFWVKRLQD
jgi:hypothetical protein